MKLNKFILTVSLLLWSMQSFAQDLVFTGNPDTSFINARDLAFAGNRTVARDTLNHILSTYPEYTDVRNLLAKTLSWDGYYEKARKEFNRITSEDKFNKEVWIAAIKNEIYAQENYNALGLVNKALSFLKEDADLLHIKESILQKKHIKKEGKRIRIDYEEERKKLNQITSVDRTNKAVWLATVKNEIDAEEFYLALGLANKALRYLENDPDLLMMKKYATHLLYNSKKINGTPNQLTTKTTLKDTEATIKSNRLRVSNAFEVFDKAYESMIFTTVEYQRETKAGTIIPRVNYNNRFQTHGVQYEIDFYPKFSKTLYGYLNYGYSASPIFPDHRVGGELYANLPKKLEASAGFRFLDFAETKVTIYTGSVGLYSGNYYLSLRPFITPNSNGNTGISGNLLVRKYLKDANTYFGLRAGMGFSPELKQLRSGGELLSETLLYVKSQQLQFEYQFTGANNSNSYKANLGVTHQELIFDSNNFFWSISVGLQYQVAF